MAHPTNLELRSLITSDGHLKLWLEETPVVEPGPDEILVRMEAAALNPSDQLLLLGPVDPATLEASGTADRPVIEGIVPKERLPPIAGRLDRSLPIGNEGAGTVIAAGAQTRDLIGKTVSIRAATGTYSLFQTVKASDCLVLKDGMTARDGAAAFINPLTALGMVETMRREGHSALVHTAAASNLGQMLVRLCLAEGISLVNIVRSQEQADLLRELGAKHVVDSQAPDFNEALIAAIEQTGATLAFDAIGGGTMAGTILAAIERVQAAKLTSYSRYGSPVHKQVYIYGMLDPSPRRLEGQFGMAWGVGGWLMTWFFEKIGAAEATRLKRKAADELDTTFASKFTGALSLAEMLSLEAIRLYSRRTTGEKYLVAPQGPTA